MVSSDDNKHYLSLLETNMASDDDEIPDTGAIFTFGKTRFAENLANKFWIRDDKVLHLSCGDEHSAVITNTGRLYTFGSNDWGQLGHGNNKPYTKPGVVKRLKGDKVKSVSCGRSHTLVITESSVFSFGAGADSQLGHGDNQSYNVPTRITAFENETISKIACGAEHSVAITDSGKLYVWGSGSEGQLGLGISDCELPTELKFRPRPISVACGYYHTAVVTEDGKLFTFGDNEGGKLGLDDEQCENTDEPQQVNGIKDRVVSVACGGSHTAVVTDRGTLYTMGYGMHGQLGHGPSCQEASTPKRVAALQRKHVTAVSCGESHTAVVTRSGELFVCGDGRHGKLGMGDDSFSNLFQPTRVTRFKGFHVSLVSCGGCHMLAVAARSTDDDGGSGESDVEASTQASAAQDVVDGPIASPRLAATMPPTGMSARDKRRLKELENTSLGGSLPPLNRSSLPPLTTLGLSPVKKDTDLKPISSNGFNPLDRSMLPTIAFKDGSADEKTGSMEKASLDQSISGRRLPPRPKKRQKKPTSASDSEDEEVGRNRENNRRPKPTPRKRQDKTQDQVDGASGNKQVETEKKCRATKKKPRSGSSGGDSEYESECDDKEVPTASRSLAETKKSEKISAVRAKHDDSGHEEEGSEDSDEEVEKVLDKREGKASKERMATKVEANEKADDGSDHDDDDDGDDSKSEDEHEGDGETKSKVKDKGKGKAESNEPKKKEDESEEDEDEDDDDDEGAGEESEVSEDNGGETSKKANREDDKEKKDKTKGKKVEKEDTNDENEDEQEKDEKAKGKGKKKYNKTDKTEGKSKKSPKDKKKKDGGEEEEGSAGESGEADKNVERVGEENAEDENKENEAGEGSSQTKDGEKQEENKDSKSGGGKKSKRSGVCVLF